jgi:hypothetical protein
MKKRPVSVMLACLLALSFLTIFSCTSFQISGVEVAAQPVPGDVLGTFDIKVSAFKMLGGAAGVTLFNTMSNATDPKIINAIRAEVAKLGGSKAVNVRIEYRASFIQLFLNGITAGIIAPATAHVTGTVVR